MMISGPGRTAAHRSPLLKLANRSTALLQPRRPTTYTSRLFYSDGAAREIPPGHLSPGRSSSRTPVNFGVCMVPQQSAWVVERFGRFNTVLEPGLNLLIPVIDKIAYVHSLKEQAIPIHKQNAITLDNVTIEIDGILYIKITDAKRASYGVEDVAFSVMQLAQTTMRSELGKLTLDQTFANRDTLNVRIVESINLAAEDWGLTCLRYEIKDITPPVAVKHAMDLQAEAERRKRASILDSEGEQQAAINRAHGQKQALMLEAEGEARSMEVKAVASAEAIARISESIKKQGGKEAVAMRVAEQYVEAFGNLAQRGTTMLLPANTGDVSSMIAQAMSIYGNVSAKTGSPDPRPTYDVDRVLEETKKEQ